ncbi:MAG TPA: hypothetical protein VMU84_12455, partial [Thermoanaerobaculia bacterium]|nr:hypothetical protein [Thermoanaerobaculia bacterium]
MRIMIVAALRARLPLVLMFTVSQAWAGVALEFETRTSSTASYQFRGRALIDGANARYDVLNGAHPVFNPQITIISRDGGQNLIVIDHRQRTWFMRRTGSMSGPLSTWKAPGQTANSHGWVKNTRAEEASEVIAGQPTTKYTTSMDYTIDMNIEGEKLKAHVVVEATTWMMESKGVTALPYGLHFGLKSGFASIDESVAKRFGGKGIPLRQLVTVTRTIADGDPIVEKFELNVDRVSEEKTAPSVFQA